MRITPVYNYYTGFKPLSNNTFYNPSFGKTAVWTKNLSNNDAPVRFDSVSEASNATGVTYANIFAALKGKTPTAGKHTFIKASDVEDKEGDIEQAKMDDFIKFSIRQALSKAIYAKKVDGDKELLKFNCVNDAHDTLKIPQSKIYQCLFREIPYADGYIFLKGDEVEDEDGNIDTSLIEEFLDDISKQKAYKALYMKKINSDDEPTRYESQTDAFIATGIRQGTIYKCLNNPMHSYNGYIFMRASDIEDKNGNINKEKVNKYINAALRNLSSKAVYVIKLNSNEPIKKYKNSAQAGVVLGIDPSGITRCLRNDKNIVKNYIFIKASEIEDENGNIVDEKLDEFLKEKDNRDKY